MLKQSQKLTDGLIIFSVLMSDYEKLDFKNDALAGVRANYFNSKNSPQQDKTEIELDSRTYNLSYLMQSGSALSWKVTRDNLPYQSVKRATGGVYSVMFYTESGIIYKRQYFNREHKWIRTEYFSRNISNKLICRIYPEVISKIIVLTVENLFENGSKTVKRLYPSALKPQNGSAALIYSNVGMLWYDESCKPEDMPETSEEAEMHGGFIFTGEQFKASYQPKNTFDMKSCDYLELPVDDGENDEAFEEEPVQYSAYDKIERILSEAQKTNKDLFGEIITQTADDNFDNSDNVTEEADITENTDDTADKTEKSYEDAECSDSEKSFEISETPPCDAVIITKSGRYTYYGELDGNNCRTGRGRTVTPDGLTSYDGEYADDMRNGFGVCYYKDGSINYVGNWDKNCRSGKGVGYRHSDGIMHAGRWNNNAPDGYGARFTDDGELLDVCMYQNGVRSGKSVSFNENGEIVVSTYENGVKISEYTVNCEEQSE